MRVMFVRNVCEALPAGVSLLLDKGVRSESRAGEVIVSPGPVTTVYERPWERVLTSSVRDANPFFHLFESLWMLSGRNDSKSLDYYVKDFGSRFAEQPGGIIHGAYGHRWRHALGFDQLDHVVETLKRDPTSRQCVIQMWDGRHDADVAPGFGGGSDDLRGAWRDRPCNTHIYLRVRKEFVTETDPEEVREKGVVTQVERSVLDLTVCCRSNDIIWGAYGANAVHFSVLQEYLAARIGVSVGKMYQMSNNYHAYAIELTRIQNRAGRSEDPKFDGLYLVERLLDNRYPFKNLVPLVKDPETFDRELDWFLRWHNQSWDHQSSFMTWEETPVQNRFFTSVAVPMTRARIAWEYNTREVAVSLLKPVAADDWRTAAQEWMARRMGVKS